jgi:hypothetical protein
VDKEIIVGMAQDGLTSKTTAVHGFLGFLGIVDISEHWRLGGLIHRAGLKTFQPIADRFSHLLVAFSKF